ncbi:GNAT family N-acetyltransferase [Emticicia fluvialis]|uniref:GNAT family N-acetyltransferase n=1 Tax=Emticicia fluvialis TaxID=2974474 RepID=UPI0021651FF1|nr:GNAT family N-acetyltransferase [Emticicia fluvialis]
MTISYRKATLADVKELARLRVQFLKEVQSNETHQTDEEGLRQTLEDYFHLHLGSGEIVVWLAEADGKIVCTSGLCFFRIFPGFSLPDGRVAYILNVYTLPLWRKKGLGKEIFSRIVEEAKNLGYKRIQLHASEEGRPIYEKYGFKATSDEMELRLD